MPGYILHLTESQMIQNLLAEDYGCTLSEEWRRRFALGCLLPDTKRRGEKAGSHFWNPEERENLALAPDLVRFGSMYGRYFNRKGQNCSGAEDSGTDPGLLGYYVHLDLDHRYVCEFWNRILEFRGEAGEPEVKSAEIRKVFLKHTGEEIPTADFFSDRYYYGDYTRMNSWLAEMFGIRVPEYRPEEWLHFPVHEVDPEDLRQVLAELHLLMQADTGGQQEHLQVFDREELVAFIRECAVRAAAEIAGSRRMSPRNLHNLSCGQDESRMLE